jgi:nucleotide-binding universal stress UspA family protein/nitrite reductase/ring-hydroxylating ferredoxin subunit
MGYRTIVVGTDGSATAKLARRTAARVAPVFGARMVLVSAYREPAMSRTKAEDVLRHAARDFGNDGLEVETLAREGDPAEVLKDVAREAEADLIVIGSRGMGRLTRFRPQSVPDRVAHGAPCDVLMVRTTGPDAGRSAEWEQRPYDRIVIGTDGSPTASEAARKAFDLGMILGIGVTLVYAAGDPIVGAIHLERTAKAKPRALGVKREVVEGAPADVLASAARAEGSALLVVGNKGMAGARRVLGSVPLRVAHSAPTDLLIAKTVERRVEDLAPGHGGVVDVGGRRLAVYRDEDGTLHSLSPRCQHMGCTVDWNDAQKTWDCPCHGSRYDRFGKVIAGPSEKDLDPAPLEE